MIDIRRRADHYRHNTPWLEADWHFSFSRYQDPENRSFGPLRVVNYDRVDPGGGWGMHSHRNMEIITWIIQGKINHRDSTGDEKVVSRNSIQKMSAGSGISHSEYNASEDEELHLLQMWIEPDTTGIESYYQEAHFEEDRLQEQFFTIASDNEAPITIEQDVRMSVAHLEKEELDYSSSEERRIYGTILRGSADLNGNELSEGDAIRVTHESFLPFQSSNYSEIVLIDLP